MTARPRAARGRSRAAFTLLELLAVILIIAILVALAFPAYQAVMRSTRNATIRAEISAIDGAIATFKSQYNTEPPSRIRFQTSTGTTPADPSALAPETKAILRKMFPQIDLSPASAVEGSLTTAGLWGHELRGGEALVFFLGGVRRFDTASSTLTTDLVGFSKNPLNPFAQPAAGQSSRLGPSYEFDSGRLRPRTAAEVPAARVGNLVYLDKFPGQSQPLLYASSAATGTLAETDVRATPKVASPSNVDDFYTDGFLPIDSQGNYVSTDTAYGLYKKSGGGVWSANGYLIVSPGPDALYGRGGPYTAGSTGSLNQRDTDNLTNFSDGPLGG